MTLIDDLRKNQSQLVVGAGFEPTGKVALQLGGKLNAINQSKASE